MRWKSLVALSAAVPLLVAAAQPVRMQPSSRWVLDYGDDSCRLLRTFGEGSDAIILSFESEAPGSMDMLVVGRGLSSSKAAVDASFLPADAAVIKEGKPVLAHNGRPAILWSSVRLLPRAVAAAVDARSDQAREHPELRPPSIPLAQKAIEKAAREATAAGTTEIRIETGRPMVLETGSLGEAIKMFDQCTRNSLRDWGVDPDLEDKIARPAWAVGPVRWISADDYPVDMVMNNQESEVKARLLVDASGRVTKCTSLSRYQSAEFKKIVCDAFTKRAKVEPAELADGTKVPSYYNVHVHFQIEQ